MIKSNPARHANLCPDTAKSISCKTCDLPSATFVIFMLVAALIIPTVRVYGEEKRLSLREALETAFKDNHALKAGKNSVSAAREDIGIARSNLLPRLTFEERFMRTTNPTYAFMTKLNQERTAVTDFNPAVLNNPAAVNDFQTGVTFEQPIFVKQAFVGLDMAERQFSAGSEDLKRKKEELAYNVVRTYLIVGTAREYVAVGEKGVEDAKEHFRIAELRFKSGLGLFSDTLRASTSLADAEQKLVSARKNLNVAGRLLGLLLGLPEQVDTNGTIPEFDVAGIEYYTAAAATRSDLKSLELRSENARENIKLAEAAYFPMIGVGGGYQLNDHARPFGSEGDSWQVTAFLRWNLFDGTKREHERTKAMRQADEAEEHLKGMKDAVAYKVFEAYAGVEEAKKNAELAAKALKTAEEGKRLVQSRYENSLSPIVDLLDAQVSLDHSRATLTARENDYRISVINLSFESGIILKDLKLE